MLRSGFDLRPSDGGRKQVRKGGFRGCGVFPMIGVAPILREKSVGNPEGHLLAVSLSSEGERTLGAAGDGRGAKRADRACRAVSRER